MPASVITYPEETYDGEKARLAMDSTGKFIGIYAPNSQDRCVIISADAPSDADGRPDGTVYFQTA